jgi:hypothetical protein
MCQVKETQVLNDPLCFVARTSVLVPIFIRTRQRILKMETLCNKGKALRTIPNKGKYICFITLYTEIINHRVLAKGPYSVLF